MIPLPIFHVVWTARHAALNDLICQILNRAAFPSITTATTWTLSVVTDVHKLNPASDISNPALQCPAFQQYLPLCDRQNLTSNCLSMYVILEDFRDYTYLHLEK